jgi:hypothetical protein
MGRPIKRQIYLGPKAAHQIQATVWPAGAGSASAGYLTKQNSDERFVAVATNALTNPTLCQLVNTAPGNVSQATVKFFPSNSAGNVTVEASASANLKVVGANLVYGGTGYTANAVLTLTGGTFGNASTITVNTVNGANGAIATFTLNTVANQQYTALPGDVYIVPVTTSNASSQGASFNVSFGIESVQITNNGAGYGANVTSSISGGITDPVLSTTTANGNVTAITVSSAGSGFTYVPPVGIEDFSGTTEYVKHLAAFRVITWTGNVYRWLPRGVAVPPDYNNINYGFLDTL